MWTAITFSARQRPWVAILPAPRKPETGTLPAGWGETAAHCHSPQHAWGACRPTRISREKAGPESNRNGRAPGSTGEGASQLAQRLVRRQGASPAPRGHVGKLLHEGV